MNQFNSRKLNLSRSESRGLSSFFVSKKKKIINSSIATITILTLIGGIYYNTNQAQGVDFTFSQTNWIGGLTTNTATHADNQTGWNQYESKDANTTLINSGADIALTSSTGNTSVDFNTEAQYDQQDATNGTDFSGTQATLHGNGVSATGGTITYTDSSGLNPRTSPAYAGGYTVHKFTSSGTFNSSGSGNVAALVVGGGGGAGGVREAGGGGAGGVLYNTAVSVSAQSYNVVVGAGGTGSSNGSATNGANSSFSTITAIGGGAGNYGAGGQNGGSGGGGQGYISGNLGGLGTSGQGYNGGYGIMNEGTGGRGGGGGGGAGGAGGVPSVTTNANGGNGGSGISNSISGVASYYGGGGGGAAWDYDGVGYGGTGGNGGGGHGDGLGRNSIVGGGTNGTANTGGGAGGGGASGFTGGSGIVIIRYPTAFTYPTSQPYYITTSPTSQKNTSTWGSMTGVVTTQTTPTNTNLKYLVSFDNKTTWKYWNGSSWQTSALASIATNGMTETSIEAITQSQWSTTGGFTPGTIDFAASLSSTSSAVTPSLDNIQINYVLPQTQTLTSNTYNTQLGVANISKIQWTESIPTNTDIKFQLRTSSDGTTWSSWCGPDNATPGTCDSSTYFTDPTGNEIIDDTQKDRASDQYFQYKAFLSSTNGVATPTLSDLSVTYNTIIAPNVTTSTASNITSYTATGNGNITNTGGENPSRFVEWGITSGNYLSSCAAGTGGAGTFTCSITGLSPNTTYYTRTKATNSAGTYYGSEVSFTTPTLPIITITNPNTTPAQSKTITASSNKGTINQSITTGTVCDNTLTFTAYASTTFSAEADNGKKICYKADDTNSGITYSMSNAIAGIDRTNPSISITNPNTTAAQSKTITASTNEGTLTQSITTGTTCDNTLTFTAYASTTFSAEADNGKKVCYKAVDTATNTSYSMSNAIAGIDRTNPIITITNPDTTANQSKTITASTNEGTLTQSITTGTLCDNSLTFSAYASTTFSTEADNGKKICYKALDSATNTSYSMSNAIAGIDRTNPIITITNPNTTSAQSKTITASTNEGTLTQSITTGTLCDSSLTFSAYASTTFSAEADNGKKVCYKAVDTATNTSYSMSNAIAGIDRTNPIITITNPNTTSAQSKTITASTNEGTLTQSITTGTTCDNSLTFSAYASTTFSAEADNGKKVCYKAVDTATNTSYSMSNAIAGIDTTAPTGTTTINNEASYTNTDSVTINNDVTDATEMRFKNETGGTFSSWITYATTYVWNLVTGDGLKTLYAEFRDSANNILSTSDTITLDTTNSVITINNPNTDPQLEKTITASVDNGTLTQSITTGTTCDNSLTFTAYQSTTFSTEADNGKKVCYKAIDSATNTSYSMSNAISGIDRTNPTISANNNSNSWQTTNPTITLSTNDTNLNYSKYSWDTNDSTCRTSGTTFTNNNTINIPSEGTHTLYLCNSDSATNTNEWNGTYKLDSIAPTINSITSDCQNTIDPNFIIDATDATSDLATNPYSFDAGATWQSQSNKTYTDFNHTIPINTIKVKDQAGNIATYNASKSQSCVIHPTMTTNPTTNIKTTTATGNGTITDIGGENPERLIEWGITTNSYTNSCSSGIGPIGAYSCNLTGLNPNTTYYTRAKATNSSGTSYGLETTFQTLPTQITIINPDTNKIDNALSSNYVSLNSGSITSTDQVVTNTNILIQGTKATITLPINTQITNTDSGNFNFQDFTTQDVSSAVNNELGNSRVAIKIGVENTKLSFSNPITLTIEVGEAYNGQLMDVFYQNENETDWHAQTTCTITEGKCTFTTTHATTYSVNGDGNMSGITGINLNTDIQEVISLDCGTSIVNMGNLTPGTPVTGSSTCLTTTNANGGYNLSVQRDDSTDTTMDKTTEDSTNITDKPSWSPSTPNATTWSGTGLGFTVYDSTANKNTTWWGTGNSINDSNNLYAGFSPTQTDIMRHTTYSNLGTTTSIGYKLDVPPQQKSGAYSGAITYQVVTTP